MANLNKRGRGPKPKPNSLRQKRRLADMDMSKPLNRSDRRAVSAMKRKGK